MQYHVKFSLKWNSLTCTVQDFDCICNYKAMYMCAYVYHCYYLNYSGSAAHGNFNFIGPALTTLCSSIREKVLTSGDESERVIKKGDVLYLLYIITASYVSIMS